MKHVRQRSRSNGPTNFDAYADLYGAAVQRSIDFSGQDHGFFTRRKAEHVIDLASRLLGDVATLRALDVGCGVGTTDAYLANRFAQLQGADKSKEAIRRAEVANPSVRYLTYDGETLPYESKTFDLAFAICVLHHVAPPERFQFASELRRVVRDGGLVAIFEHNPFNPLTRLAVGRCEFDEDAVLVRASSVRQLLQSAQLRPTERRYVILFPSSRSRIRALENAVGGLPLAAQYYVAARR